MLDDLQDGSHSDTNNTTTGAGETNYSIAGPSEMNYTTAGSRDTIYTPTGSSEINDPTERRQELQSKTCSEAETKFLEILFPTNLYNPTEQVLNYSGFYFLS